MATTPTTLETLNAADHVINYFGTLIPISGLTTKRLYAKFLNGGGYGDQSYWCKFHSTYGIYRIDKTGKLLERVGTFNEVSGTDGSNFTGVIDGKAFSMEGYAVDNVFMKIFEKETLK